MIKKLTILLAIALSACTVEKPVTTSDYEMKCEQVFTDFIINVHRCENKEIICYKTTKGISCQRKENQNG